MNREEKTHWTQDKILLYVKACMSATGLTRMPSRSELSEYYGNDKLTNAIRRFPGGYYKIVEILNVKMKESETQFGKYGEDLATKLLEEHGFSVERMSTRYAYDLYVNGSVTVTKNCKEGYDHNGIDRVDSSKGYSAENVVPCCKICNRGKANMSKEDFIEWACRIAKHSQAMSEQWG